MCKALWGGLLVATLGLGACGGGGGGTTSSDVNPALLGLNSGEGARQGSPPAGSGNGNGTGGGGTELPAPSPVPFEDREENVAGGYSGGSWGTVPGGWFPGTPGVAEPFQPVQSVASGQAPGGGAKAAPPPGGGAPEPVPEPETIILMLMGGAALAFVAWKRNLIPAFGSRSSS